MGVPFWREVEYTDDGCSIFQCLFCKAKWEARTSPGYYRYKCGKCDCCVAGKYLTDGTSCYGQKEFKAYCPFFVYCPCCGIRWDGQMHRPENHRKAKIEKILDNMSYEDRTRYRPQKELFWAIEECRRGIWVIYKKYRRSEYSRKEILNLINGLRNDEKEFHSEYPDSARFFYRIKLLSLER